ncbi:hypothetical protein GCM10027200_37750 [Lentzea nigeriaca]
MTVSSNRLPSPIDRCPGPWPGHFGVLWYIQLPLSRGALLLWPRNHPQDGSGGEEQDTGERKIVKWHACRVNPFHRI